ncbi:MAG: mechanosensitive ion channel [Synechococcales bacterium]|nr:mechanosensitive ion channel [Synechococcales bacterium]
MNTLMLLNGSDPLIQSFSLYQMFPLAVIDANTLQLFWDYGLKILGAAAILLLGFLIAWLVSKTVKGLLKRTNVDNQVASWISGSSQGAPLDIEGIIAGIVFWIIGLLAIVAALNSVGLSQVSEPLNRLLGQVFAALPNFGYALALSALAWLVATIVRGFVIQAARSFDLDGRLNRADAENPIVMSETLGNALYWFVFLFFLPIILGLLGLQGALGPVQNMLDQILAALPKILKAGLIFGAGWLIASIVRGIVSNLSAAAGADRFGAQFGVTPSTTGQPLSTLLGTLVFVLTLVPFITESLAALEMRSLSVPATNMLNLVTNSLPLIGTAAVILGFSWVVSKFIAELIIGLVGGFLDRLPAMLGIRLVDGSAPPSEIGKWLIRAGIMLSAVVGALEVFAWDDAKRGVLALLNIFGNVLVGVAIFAIGLYLANLAVRLIQGSGIPQSNMVANAARISILAFSGAMALDRAGVSPNIVNLAFGLLLGAVAVAIAIAFGLGGRDVAGEQLRDWVKPFKR